MMKVFWLITITIQLSYATKENNVIYIHFAHYYIIMKIPIESVHNKIVAFEVYEYVNRIVHRVPLPFCHLLT